MNDEVTITPVPHLPALLVEEEVEIEKEKRVGEKVLLRFILLLIILL